MKRIISYVVLIILFTSLGVIGYMNKPKDLPSVEVLNKKYYRFDSNTGEYDELTITEDYIDYSGEKLDLKTCREYTYTAETSIFKLDCNKAFRFVGITIDPLVINLDQKNYYFYTDKEKSYNGEFQRTFKMTLESYLLEGETIIKTKEINGEKLRELIALDTNSYIYIKGSACVNECAIFNKAFPTLSSKDNIYYYDITKLTDIDVNYLKTLNPNLPETISEYNQTYPQLLVVGRQTAEIINIEVKGFNLSQYMNYIDNLEVNNEQNN